jgi:hypothetical protein
VLIMMILTSLETVPASVALTFPSGVAELMIAVLLISALGIAGGVLRRALGGGTASGRARGTGRMLAPVARQAVAA